MHEFRITKYDPSKRNDSGHYLDKNEWTEFSDVGKSVTIEDYEKIESAYIKSAVEMIKGGGITSLEVVGLENHFKKCKLKENMNISVLSLEPVLRSLLRGDCWFRLESSHAFIHIGYDYYMYVGVSKVDQTALKDAESRGLYVEKFISPYHPENR